MTCRSLAKALTSTSPLVNPMLYNCNYRYNDLQISSEGSHVHVPFSESHIGQRSSDALQIARGEGADKVDHRLAISDKKFAEAVVISDKKVAELCPLASHLGCFRRYFADDAEVDESDAAVAQHK